LLVQCIFFQRVAVVLIREKALNDIKEKPHLLVGLFTLAGATGLEQDNLPESSSGRSNQLFNISSIPLPLDLTLTP
jgi:hypothetical protein